MPLFYRALSLYYRRIRFLCGSFHFNNELALPKKSQDSNDEAFNFYDYCLYGLCYTVQEDVEKVQHMKLAFEGYLHAASFHGIFHTVPSDYADDDSIEIPGTVKTTKFQIKKIENPNWAVVPKKTASTYIMTMLSLTVLRLLHVKELF